MVLRERRVVNDGPAGIIKGPVEQAHALVCMGCNSATVVIEVRDEPRATPTPVHWWPTPGVGRLDPAVPGAVAKAYDEGVRCLAVAAPHAAVTMLRSALAQIVLDKGSAAAKTKVQRNLKDGVTQWRVDGLHEALADWAEHARLVGNAGAHQEAYEELSNEDAEDLRRLVDAFMNVVYVVPAQIARAQGAGVGTKRT